MSKKLSLLIVCFGLMSAAAVAQDGTKTRKAQEPVRVAPAEKVQKTEVAPVAEKQAAPVSPAPATMGTAPVKRTPYKKVPAKRVVAVKPAAAKAEAVEIK